MPAEEVMKKKFFLVIFVFLFFSSYLFAFGAQEHSKKVVVYAYDSFTAEWGPGPEIKKQFESKTGYELEFVTFEDATSVLTQAISEGGKCRADVLVGIDNFQFPKARLANILQSYKPKNVSHIKENLIFDKDFFVVPYDYGFFTLMYDTTSKVPAPTSLSDLTDSQYKKTVIIMDPRTSTPGTGFLAWTRAAFGEKYLDFWKAIKSSLLTMAPDWSSGYGLFTSGEAPFALSYTSSEAYHVAYDKTSRYKALTFSEGHIMQIESMGILKNAKNIDGAKAFIEFMISETAQNILPETQWMYPVSLDVALPESYRNIAIPKNILPVDEAIIHHDTMLEQVIHILK